MKKLALLALIAFCSCNQPQQDQAKRQPNEAQIRQNIIDSMNRVHSIREIQKDSIKRQSEIADRELDSRICDDNIETLNSILAEDNGSKSCDGNGIKGTFKTFPDEKEAGSMVISFDAIMGIKTVKNVGYGNRCCYTSILAYGKWYILESYIYLIGMNMSRKEAEKYETMNKQRTDWHMARVIGTVKDIVQCKSNRSI